MATRGGGSKGARGARGGAAAAATTTKRGSSTRSAPSGEDAGGNDGSAAAGLAQRVQQLEESLATERRQRNYFQVQGERLNEFWDVTKRELEEARAALRMKDRALEDAEERHMVEVRVLQQQARHLAVEHGSDVARAKAGAEAQLRTQEDAFGEREDELKASCRRLQAQLHEAGLAHDELTAALKVEHERQLTRLRGEFEDRCRELEQRYERRMGEARAEAERRRQNEVREAEERKNAHIAELMQRHERAFAEMKAYYNGIFASNADLVRTLREQLAEARQREADHAKEVADVRGENRRMAEPLEQAQARAAQMAARAAELEKELSTLRSSKARVAQLDGQLRAVRWENEVLIQRFERVERERDELYTRFLTAVRDVQQRSGMRAQRLEQRIAAFREALEARDTQMREVVRAANLDPAAAALATRQIEDTFAQKNAIIRDLQYELARVGRQHTDMLRTYEAKLEEHGIPRDTLGFTPMEPDIPEAAASVVVPGKPVSQ